MINFDPKIQEVFPAMFAKTNLTNFGDFMKLDQNYLKSSEAALQMPSIKRLFWKISSDSGKNPAKSQISSKLANLGLQLF